VSDIMPPKLSLPLRFPAKILYALLIFSACAIMCPPSNLPPFDKLKNLYIWSLYSVVSNTWLSHVTYCPLETDIFFYTISKHAKSVFFL
jgi:hypothetical protein